MIVFKQELSLIAALLLPGLGSCAMNTRDSELPPKSDSVSSEQNQNVETSLRKAWEDKAKGLDKHSKDYPLQKLTTLQSLLADVPQQQAKKEFDKVALSPVGYSDLDEYEQTLVQTFVTNSVASQDRPALVTLFSSKAPEFIGGEPIALYLSNSSIPSPLLVLFDSYDRTTNVYTKKDLLSVLGHAFRSIRDKLTGDDEFVIQSREWYLQNQAKLELNPYYHPDALFAENRELFVVKSKSQNPR